MIGGIVLQKIYTINIDFLKQIVSSEKAHKTNYSCTKQNWAFRPKTLVLFRSRFILASKGGRHLAGRPKMTSRTMATSSTQIASSCRISLTLSMTTRKTLGPSEMMITRDNRSWNRSMTNTFRTRLASMRIRTLKIVSRPSQSRKCRQRGLQR